MALSEKTALRLWASVAAIEDHPAEVVKFARAIEAEVRKQDTALIRQLVESLEGYRRNHNDNQPCDAERAGRARLKEIAP